jgi:hypothetical protein
MARNAERHVLALNGNYGTDVQEGAGTLTGGPWVALIAKGATTITSLTGNWSANPGALADGEDITGIFTSVTISGGKLYCKRTIEATEFGDLITVT